MSVRLEANTGFARRLPYFKCIGRYSGIFTIGFRAFTTFDLARR
ncbi:hypothetical protein D3OALGA1CA_4954 [Olavius algarvensis associated proteobacterium Delta 3]|nr:hypothetical protein D3OALGA1CA_4954 [Olavius algarvensis associated proteobacterium Delta 3]